MRSINNKYLLLLVIICGVIFFMNLSALPVNIMEARNFTSAREMLHDGNWLLTTLNGEPQIPETAVANLAFSIFGSVV